MGPSGPIFIGSIDGKKNLCYSNNMRKPKQYYNSITKKMIENDVENNLSQYEIANKYGITRQFVRDLFHKFGITISNRRTQPPIDKDILIKENHKNLLTLKQISAKYNRTYKSIKDMFKKYNISPKNNVIHKNIIKREEILNSIELNQLYGKLTKIEVQKQLNIGQKYLDEALKEKNIERKFFNRSSQEKELEAHLKAVMPNETILSNVKNIISKEIDIFVPNKNVGIELHGLYWHNPIVKNIGKKYHYDKATEAHHKDILLLQFFEDEWILKKEICKSIILTNLGIYQKLYARKCSIKIITNQETKEFCEHNHLQGHTNASVCLGLYYNTTLVSIMSFGRPRFHKSAPKDQWELLRFCSILNTKVIGGASKLFSYFINNFKPKHIYSYSDRRISKGDLYTKLNFKLEKITEPNYSYIVGKQRSNRMNWQKNKLKTKLKIFDPNLTEIENMVLNKYFPIYDAGNILWSWSNENKS